MADFQTDLQEWRKSRPEWKALLAGVKADRPLDELKSLAVAAGATGNELADLRTARNRAKNEKDVASRFPSDQKKLEKLNAEVERLTALAEAATADEYGDRIADLQQAVGMRDRFSHGDYTSSKVAHDYHQVVEKMGLI